MRLKRKLRGMFRWLKPKTKVKHVCDITKGSESHLPRLPPNAAIMARVKRRLQKILLVSANHPLTHLYLRSQAAIAFEKRRHGISSNWWTIHPCSPFRFFWDVVMAFTYLYMFFMIPHMLSIYRIPDKNTNVIDVTLNVLNPGYIICLIDIVLNFLTGFISTDGHEIYLNSTVIMKHYAQRFFIPDLISSVPYMWFHKKRLETPKEDAELYLLFLELLPLVKLFRMCSFRTYVKEICLACSSSRTAEHGIWIFIMTILIFHWAACFTYAFPFFYAYAKKRCIEKSEGYLFNTKLYNKSGWLIYLTSLHMGAGNLCSYSFIQFRYTDLPDKIVRCILLLFGNSYFLYVIVIILQLVSSSAEPELKYQSIMYGVKDYITNKKLPPKLKDRLLHFYEHRFQGSLFKERAITSTLSKHLKHEITQHSSRILLESTQLFSNLPRNLLNNIIGALKLVIFLQDDVIYRSGVEGKCMYFIITGTVAVMTYSGKEICHLRDGDFFGEIALIQHNFKRISTVVALEVCEVLRLERRDFNRLISSKSEFYARLELIARQRIHEYEEVEKAFLKSTKEKVTSEVTIRE